MNDQAHRILAAIRARGCEAMGHKADPGEFRHAVHEAVHGIRLGAKSWSNDAIHRACTRVRSPSNRLMEELIARAVEQLVCQRLGVACDTVEHFAFWTCMEALKNRVDIGGPDEFARGVRRYMEDTRTVAPLVEQVLALGAADTQSAPATGAAGV
jgi:hypothetical protein